MLRKGIGCYPKYSENVPATNRLFSAQDKGRSIRDALFRFYKSGSHTDVSINVRWRGEVTVFRAHKLILATRSSVFARELFNSTQGSLSFVTFVVEGVPPHLIELLLLYFYSDELSVESPKHLIGFAKVAKYYQVAGADSLCKQKLFHYEVEEKNVWSLLDAATHFRIESICRPCIEYIRNDLKRLLSLPEFLTINKKTFSVFETEFHPHLTEHESLAATLRWLQHNKQAEGSVLSKYDISSLSVDGFLDMLESFPSFLSEKDALAILANKLRPQITMELPSWYDSNSKQGAPFDDIDLSVAMVVDRCLRLEIPFQQQLSTSSMFGPGGFECQMTLQLKLAHEFPHQLSITMIELAFGSSFVPEDNIDIKIFAYCYGIQRIKKKQLKFMLHSTSDNYYIITKEVCSLHKITPFILTIRVKAKGLRHWREDGLMSNNQFRMLQIPQRNNFSACLSVEEKKAVTLTTLSNWLALVAPKEGTKSFLFTAFYFNKN